MTIYRPFKFVPPLKEEEVNDNYTPYIIVNNIFNKKEIESLLSLWNEDNARQGTVLSDKNQLKQTHLDLEQRSAKELFIDAENNEWVYDKIAMTCIMSNASVFKLNITGFIGKLRMLKYETGDFFEWHMDYGPSKSSNRKLVVCIQLSDEDDYEGGELQLQTEKINAPKTKGSAVIFPSYLLHRVTPVSSGCRKSLVALIAGPPYK